MTDEIFSRTAKLIGENAVEILKNAKVAVFGAGGVGGYVIEALARAGVGNIDIVDGDTVALSNINRQIIALQSTLGKNKAETATERCRDINPEIKAQALGVFFTEETYNDFDLSKYDYIVDAVDSVTAKIELIVRAKALNVPIISSMGAGNKLDPTAFKVSDIYKTSVCPLARVMRRELKKRDIKSLKVVYSAEEPIIPLTKEQGRKQTPSSISFVPSVAGLIIAGEVIKDLIK